MRRERARCHLAFIFTATLEAKQVSSLENEPADDLRVLSGACFSQRSPSLTFSQAENDEPQKLRDPEEKEEGNGASDGQVSRVRVDRLVFDCKTHKLSSG